MRMARIVGMPFFCLSVSGRLRLRRSQIEDLSDSLRPCLAMGAVW
jgi:hypothetical protein